MRVKPMTCAVTLGLALALLAAPFAAPLAAQNGTVTGTVRDAGSGTPIGSAGVEVLGTGAGPTLTNAQGQYSISVPAGTYSVLISTLGYRDQRVDGIRVRAGSSTTLDVTMTSQALELNPIVVTASRHPEKKTDAPATIHVVGETEIAERPVATPVDHLRSAPGVDIVQHGVQSTNVVLRGFNNIFSGALHALTDNRIAGVPSLRVNLLHFMTASNEDYERVEVVLGPGAALYGPNTANGVIHFLTRSPLTSQGTTVTLGGGEKELITGSFRTAHKLSDNFAFKLSGQYIQGDEWRFTDATEAQNRADALGNPSAFVDERIARGLSSEDANLALNRVGVRDFDFERWSVDGRADWQFADDGTLMLDLGLTNATGIELTGIGAAQIEDWQYSFFQARMNKDRLFVQAYLNDSDSGDTFLLRDGVPLVDKSRLFVGQAQHGIDLKDGKQDFTYGVDFFWTNPRTLATINGINEDDDNITEFGAYIQSKTELTDQLDLVLAGRVDTHSELDDAVWSPRVALVFEPEENHSFRLTFNRAFSTPTSLNLFLDLPGGAVPGTLGTLGYRLLAQGPTNGFSFFDSNGNLKGMRSPFNPGGAGQLLPANTATLWALGVGVLAAQGAIDAATAALLGSLQPTAADIGINVLDPNNPTAVLPLALASIPDVAKLKESTTTTIEVGYQGLINNKVLVAADVWYTEIDDFISPLVLRTPLLLLNATPAAGPDIASYLIPILQSTGMPAPVAQATAEALAAGMGEIPLGVVSSAEINARGADLLATYVNAGTLDMWGADFSVKAFVTDEWTIGASGSWVSDDYFDLNELEGGTAPLTLNAPSAKGTLSLAYRNARAGFNAEGRLRATDGFPAKSADFVGTECVPDAAPSLFQEPCVDTYALVDVTVGYKVPGSAATLQLTASNVFDTAYRSFVGVPRIGRMLIARVKYDLF